MMAVGGGYTGGKGQEPSSECLPISSCPFLPLWAPESGCLKDFTLPAVGKESSTWCWSFPFRWVLSLWTPPCLALSTSPGLSAKIWVGGCWKLHCKCTLRGLSSEAQRVQVYCSWMTLSHRMSPLARLLRKRDTPVWSSTSSSHHTQPPPKTGET